MCVVLILSCASDSLSAPFMVATDKDFYTVLASPDITSAEVVQDIRLKDELRVGCIDFAVEVGLCRQSGHHGNNTLFD